MITNLQLRGSDAQTPLCAGTPVNVRSRYLGTWGRGFEVAEELPHGYRIRRTSDRTVFPEVFAPDEVRP